MGKLVLGGSPVGGPPSNGGNSSVNTDDSGGNKKSPSKANTKGVARLFSVFFSVFFAEAYPMEDPKTDKKLMTGGDSKKHKQAKSQVSNMVENIIRFWGLVILLCLCLTGSKLFATFDFTFGFDTLVHVGSWLGQSIPFREYFTPSESLFDAFSKHCKEAADLGWYTLVWTCGVLTGLMYTILELLESSDLAVFVSFVWQTLHDSNAYCNTQIGNSTGGGIAISHTLKWKNTPCEGLAQITQAKHDDNSKNIVDLFMNAKYRPVMDNVIADVKKLNQQQKDDCHSVKQEKIDVRLWKAQTQTTNKPVVVHEKCKKVVTKLVGIIKGLCHGQNQEIWPHYEVPHAAPAWRIDMQQVESSKVAEDCALNEQLIEVKCSVGEEGQTPRNVTYEPWCPYNTRDALGETTTDYHPCSSMKVQECQFMNCLAHLSSQDTSDQTFGCKIWDYFGWRSLMSRKAAWFLPAKVTKPDYVQVNSKANICALQTCLAAMLWWFVQDTPIEDRYQLLATERGQRCIAVGFSMFACIFLMTLSKCM